MTQREERTVCALERIADAMMIAASAYAHSSHDTVVDNGHLLERLVAAIEQMKPTTTEGQ